MHSPLNILHPLLELHQFFLPMIAPLQWMNIMSVKSWNSCLIPKIWKYTTSIVFDLRVVDPGRPQKYEPFWNQVEVFINEKALEAVDSRRHGTVWDFASCFFCERFSGSTLQKNPDLEAPTPEWICAQIWPKKTFSKTACNHTGRLQTKFMIQSHQLRADHPDSH